MTAPAAIATVLKNIPGSPISYLHLVTATRSRAGVHDSCPTNVEGSGPCTIGATATENECDCPDDEENQGNDPQCMDCKPETPEYQRQKQQHENYSHCVLFPTCLRAFALATPLG